MGGSNFDLITQELLRQKQTMDQLEEENQELRRQLAELRDGRGIFVVIDGRRFALTSDGATHAPASVIEAVYPTPDTLDTPTIPDMNEAEVEPVALEPDITHEQTEELAMNAVETEQVHQADVEQASEIAPVPVATVAAVSEQNTEPTFLEEAMIDEFASATTSPLAIWPSIKQEPQKSSETDADEELALLRRQLIGSYLLE